MPNHDADGSMRRLALLIRAERPRTQHEERVKVNTSLNLGYDRTDNFSIQILPAARVAFAGFGKQSNVNAMIECLHSNSYAAIAFSAGGITGQQLVTALAARPCPAVQQ